MFQSPPYMSPVADAAGIAARVAYTRFAMPLGGSAVHHLSDSSQLVPVSFAIFRLASVDGGEDGSETSNDGDGKALKHQLLRCHPYFRKGTLQPPQTAVSWSRPYLRRSAV